MCIYLRPVVDVRDDHPEPVFHSLLQQLRSLHTTSHDSHMTTSHDITGLLLFSIAGNQSVAGRHIEFLAYFSGFAQGQIDIILILYCNLSLLHYCVAQLHTNQHTTYILVCGVLLGSLGVRYCKHMSSGGIYCESKILQYCTMLYTGTPNLATLANGEY